MGPREKRKKSKASVKVIQTCPSVSVNHQWGFVAPPVTAVRSPLHARWPLALPVMTETSLSCSCEIKSPPSAIRLFLWSCRHTIFFLRPPARFQWSSTQENETISHLKQSKTWHVKLSISHFDLFHILSTVFLVWMNLYTSNGLIFTCF